MKIRLNRAEFAEALGAVCSVAATRSPRPILQCALLQALEDHCCLIATDLEIGIRMVLNQVEVAEQNRVLVSADKLAQIVRESGDDVLEIEADGSVCHVRGKGSHFQIYCQEANEFPPVAEMPGEADFELEAADLKRLAEWTAFAAAKESTRYAINGVLWDKSGSRLIMVATDGRRLSRAMGSTRGQEGADRRAIVPGKTMQLFHRVFGDLEEPARVKITENQIIIQCARATVSSSLVEGQFPKYEDVIPNDCNKEIELPTHELLSAVRQAALLTNEESKGVRFSLTRDNLTLSSRAPEQGEATISLSVRYSGEPLDIGFNPFFLTEVLRVVRTDSVRLQLKESRRPGVLLSGDDLLHVIMPVNLS
ncbi:MAG: DNA polymerase III subunit beta [Planctomycetota bacterium]